MGSDQRFSLKWNNYQAHLVSAFESLLGDKDFVDVTLGTEGKKLPAHKMLLSACSPYFRELLKDNPCQHPIIILRDVRYEDLYSLLQFMYNGEVNVAQEQLNSFLKSAEALKIRGLTDSDDSESNSGAGRGAGGGSARTLSPGIGPTPPTTSSSASAAKKKRPAADSHLVAASPMPPPPKRVHQQQHPQQHHPQQVQSHPPAVRVITNTTTPTSSPSEPVKQEVIDLGEDNIDMDREVEGSDYPVEEEGVGRGTVAQYEGGYREEDEDEGGDLMVPGDENIEDSLHQEQGGQGEYALEERLPCAVCGKTFGSVRSLRYHFAVHTGRTECAVCGKIMSRVSHLKAHMLSVHGVQLL